MQYYCHYCHDWYDTVYCQSHFDSVHGQKNVTFEALQKRLACLGGVDTREEEEQVPDADQAPVFVTNNFRHTL